MKLPLFFCMFSAGIFSFASHSAPFSSEFKQFKDIYQQQLGSTQDCKTSELNTFKVCSSALKNDGNAPFILHHNKVTDKVVVLFHGLSDSPFFLRSIAAPLYQQGFNVVVALLPGHGQKEADMDMQDANLADRWRQHVNKVMTLSTGLAEQVYIGGFSTGGALAVEYSLQHPGSVKGIMLFSGALALSSTVESLANVWGVQWLTKLIDGEYQTIGRNPYKYPSVARFAALELLEVIFSVRQLLEQGNQLDVPLFSAHSEADATTLISGVKNLMAINKGPNTFFPLAEDLDVCHADVVINQQQLKDMQFDDSNMVDIMPCDVPKANPKHKEMLKSLQQFMAIH